MAMGKLYDAPIYIDDTPGSTPSICARAQARGRHVVGSAYFVIDYLQLMSGTREGENRAAELSEIHAR